MEFPLTLSFKKIALAPQLTVTDVHGETQFFVQQQMFKLKEAVDVYADTDRLHQLYKINADRIIDFSAEYHFRDLEDNSIGSIKRQGRQSLWRTHYDIYLDGEVVGTIQEENAFTKFLDALIGEIPFLGLITGYILNPTYLVTRPDGTVIVKVVKQPSFFESSFTIEEAVDISEAAETRTVLAILMMTLLERRRG